VATLEARRAAIKKAAEMVRKAEEPGGCAWLRRAQPKTDTVPGAVQNTNNTNKE
jgi:hypothetical protein